MLERIFGAIFGRQKLKFLIIGLDNSGKSTLINQLKPKHLQTKSKIQPTVGFNSDEFEYQGIKFVSLDMSGQAKYRDLWLNSLNETDGIVFVVDSSDELRLVVAKDELERVLLSDKRNKIPIVFFANKTDLARAGLATDLVRTLSLDLIIDRPWKMFRSNALTGQGLQEGMTWLVETAKDVKKKN